MERVLGKVSDDYNVYLLKKNLNFFNKEETLLNQVTIESTNVFDLLGEVDKLVNEKMIEYKSFGIDEENINVAGEYYDLEDNELLKRLLKWGLLIETMKELKDTNELIVGVLKRIDLKESTFFGSKPADELFRELKLKNKNKI